MPPAKRYTEEESSTHLCGQIELPPDDGGYYAAISYLPAPMTFVGARDEQMDACPSTSSLRWLTCEGLSPGRNADKTVYSLSVCLSVSFAVTLPLSICLSVCLYAYLFLSN